MTVQILFAAPSEQWADYEAPLTDALKATGMDYALATDLPPGTVDYMVYAPDSAVQDFTPYTRLKAVLNLWAGVEKVVFNPTLTAPLTRMVDEEGLTQGMVEWVTGHVLRHHLGMDRHIVNPGNLWDHEAPPLAPERPVTILGMGALGKACARTLRHLGFPVTGWSRSEKRIANVNCVHGEAGLAQALRGAQILVLLLPETRETENILSGPALSLLERGAVVINPGRGPLIDDAALLAALDSGHISHATLDVFRVEPLPKDDPYWTHPKVTITPHVASETRPASAARVIAENIRRKEAGLPLMHLVDRLVGY
ncbi:2-hydroxyacid dehydrogenase [Primorskyibacter sp. 2E107]|uniref:2-hydroxyacid dehydrogenase n=1 Tax=Primorskyibacter sp. 2E107 TaxID=3403458 RepID=UPI003AF8D42D